MVDLFGFDASSSRRGGSSSKGAVTGRLRWVGDCGWGWSWGTLSGDVEFSGHSEEREIVDLWAEKRCVCSV
ncbi:hypothetical protein DCAR_0934771 [Daucus carota subsp. sativus]|uniref:Uncharacterized protein n=1 Tax=Daucus carota subsp. sativus TaxID=79200 RepID=A0A175YGX6_DAUCS|nr:hypothetical protein DCAR_0934771 [Daucus carota subsp. sativus]